MSVGYLQVHVTAQGIALSNAYIRLFKVENEILVYEAFFMSDEQGNTKWIALPAPATTLSFIRYAPYRPYETYDIEIRKNGYYTMHINQIQIFAKERSFLTTQMQEKEKEKDEFLSYMYDIPEHLLFHTSGEKQFQPNTSFPLYANRSKDPPIGLYIPNDVIVSLTIPHQKKKQVCVPFLYYVKNIASSQMYPTWSKEVLKANIWMLLSFILRNIQTYGSNTLQAPFTITSTPYKKLWFIENRNLYESINKAVEEVFLQSIYYQTRDLYYTSCKIPNTMPYYNTCEFVEFHKKRIVPFHFVQSMVPHEEKQSLEQEGRKIAQIQKQLQTIALSYPSVSSPTITSHIDERTITAIKDVQRLLGIPVDGILHPLTKSTLQQLYEELLST